MTVGVKPQTKLADQVWIATFDLHRKHPEREDFSIEEILDQVRREAFNGPIRPGIYVHIVQHCVANRAPNPARYRMLVETGSGRRRLFRPGDPYHPGREGGRTTPALSDLPRGHLGLLRDYEEWCEARKGSEAIQDPILTLAGSGKDLWADEHADQYVCRLREGWE